MPADDRILRAWPLDIAKDGGGVHRREMVCLVVFSGIYGGIGV